MYFFYSIFGNPILLIIGIVILISLFRLRKRVKRLEALVASGRTARTDSMPSEPTDFRASVPQGVTPQAAAAVPELGPSPFTVFFRWLKQDWLLKLGALLLLIGFGWLTTYAFLNNWIGPMGRITLGIVAGALILFLGWWRIKKYLHQGSVFLVLGSTVILLTVFAAREIYHFFTPLSALAIMFLSTVFVAVASVKYKNRVLALASVILAGIAPLLTNVPQPDYISLFAYLFVVILGAIWVTALTGKRELTLAALILIVLYSLPHLSSYARADQKTLLLFAYAFAALFFITSLSGILRRKGETAISDLITAGGNGLLLLAWIMSVAQEEWRSLIIAVWMIIFGAGAFSIFYITKKREPFYVYAGVGIAMLAAATSAELHGATLTIAYTIESALIVLIAYVILRDIRIAERLNLLFIGPIALSMNSLMSSAWASTVFHKDFFVLFILGFAMFAIGWYFLPFVRRVNDEETSRLNMLVLVLGSLYFYALLWRSLHAALYDDDIAVMISLVVYTLIGIVTYFYGLSHGRRGLKIYGGILLGFVVVRLLLIDVWRMRMTGRIVTFFLIGAALASTAFLGRRKQADGIQKETS